MLLEFLLYTIIALLANASMANILFASIQPGQWLDKIFDWQKKLRVAVENAVNAKKPQPYWVKMLGYCELCFSHTVTAFGFIVYCTFMNLSGLFPFDWWMWVIWYFVYIGIGTNLSLYFLTKLFR